MRLQGRHAGLRRRDRGADPRGDRARVDWPGHLPEDGKIELRDGRTGEPFDRRDHRRPDLHAQAPPPRRGQDPRPVHRPLQPHHPAAARRQGAVRRPALRRDGGLGARGLRRREHPPGAAHGQVGRRHGPRPDVRGDRQGRGDPAAAASPSPSRCSSRSSRASASTSRSSTRTTRRSASSEDASAYPLPDLGGINLAGFED